MSSGPQAARVFTPVADYHQLYLAPPEVWPVYDAEHFSDLVQVSPDHQSLIISTGIAMGPVTLQIETLHEPDSGDDDWDESASGELDVAQPLHLTAPTVDTGVDEPAFVPERPGRYAFRLTARGRANHFDEYVETPVEAYRLRFWPIWCRVS